MRLLQTLCFDRAVIERVLTPFGANERPRSLAIVGADRPTNLTFLQGILEATAEDGFALGILEPGELPDLEGKYGVATRFVRTDPEQGLTASQLVRSFLRQDPDWIICTKVTAEVEPMLLTSALTGHFLIMVFDQPNLEVLLAELKSRHEARMLAAVLQSVDFVELDAQYSRNRIVRVARLKSDDPMAFAPVNLVHRRVPDFELGRDEQRDDSFFQALYEHAPLEAPVPPAPVVGDAREPPQVPLVDPLDLLSCAPDLRRQLRRERRVAYLPVVREVSAAAESSLKALSASSHWPRTGTAQASLLILQLDTDDLPPDFAVLPAGHLLRVFFDGLEAIGEDGDPFDASCRVQLLDKAGITAGAEPEVAGGLMKERFQIERFELVPFDYPQDSQRAADCELPISWDTKLGGWPAWQQAHETPRCSKCQTAMRFVFQFANRHAWDTVATGDFSEYLFVCPTHTDVWGFVHQCS